jgi:L-rhamnose isomerase
VRQAGVGHGVKGTRANLVQLGHVRAVIQAWPGDSVSGWGAGEHTVAGKIANKNNEPRANQRKPLFRSLGSTQALSSRRQLQKNSGSL